MTTEYAAPAETRPQPRRSRHIGRKIAVAAALIVALLAGIGIGAAGNSHSSELAASQHTVQTLNSQVATLKSQLQGAKGAAALALQEKASAQKTANQAAAAKYAARQAKLSALLAQARSTQRKLNRQEGVVQASTISQDGVYVVGKDIPAGTYHTSGGGSFGQCYYATLNSTNTSDIADNNNFNGPETVTLSGVYAFQISGGCTWHKIG